ncbi:tetraspanin-8 isoform X1 [Maylandia zebra]|uniref:tetraspanin-8 isoform X1 n=1 Tax=Maylandia zebra TaxID=106582 RepID=UPI00403D087D
MVLVYTCTQPRKHRIPLLLKLPWMICCSAVFQLIVGLITTPALLFKCYHDNFVQTTHLYIFASVTVVISILGAHGAHTANLMSLTVFLLCTFIGSLLMLRAGAITAAARPNLGHVMEERFRLLLPLDQASGDIRDQVERLQTSLHCCGLFGYKDWENSIPDSCLCKQDVEECQTVSYTNFLLNLFWQKKSVFTQPCFPIISSRVVRNANITLGVIFGLFVLTLFGMVLSSLLIYQLYNTSIRLNCQWMDQPPAYELLDDTPEKTPSASNPPHNFQL